MAHKLIDEVIELPADVSVDIDAGVPVSAKIGGVCV